MPIDRELVGKYSKKLNKLSVVELAAVYHKLYDKDPEMEFRNNQLIYKLTDDEIITIYKYLKNINYINYY